MTRPLALSADPVRWSWPLLALAAAVTATAGACVHTRPHVRLAVPTGLPGHNVALAAAHFYHEEEHNVHWEEWTDVFYAEATLVLP